MQILPFNLINYIYIKVGVINFKRSISHDQICLEFKSLKIKVTLNQIISTVI